jgi:hypothetical protein
MAKASEAVIQCPFCKKQNVKALHVPSYVTHRIEHISNRRSVVNFRVPESWEIISECPDCKKTQKEIQDNLDGKSCLSHEERIKKLQARGLPTKVEF